MISGASRARRIADDLRGLKDDLRVRLDQHITTSDQFHQRSGKQLHVLVVPAAPIDRVTGLRIAVSGNDWVPRVRPDELDPHRITIQHFDFCGKLTVSRFIPDGVLNLCFRKNASAVGQSGNLDATGALVSVVRTHYSRVLSRHQANIHAHDFSASQSRLY
ncbi:hypothetical protein SDC9_141151 [bioreactor metagenome]|uniref:Uncharacterized protein n=1 Tax=bioreactor metagenome TaxID=1076179 RepID=A0A645DXL2_9ZZZZ